MTASSPIPMRERLRTDYDWTPRQRDVLSLIARGKTNGEVGAALGISLDGAKWHVSEILSKLQAESREEAADYWRRYNGAYSEVLQVVRANGEVVSTLAGNGAAHLSPPASDTVIRQRLPHDHRLPDNATSYPVVIDTVTGKATPIVSDTFTTQRGRNRFIAFQPR